MSNFADVDIILVPVLILVFVLDMYLLLNIRVGEIPLPVASWQFFPMPKNRPTLRGWEIFNTSSMLVMG